MFFPSKALARVQWEGGFVELSFSLPSRKRQRGSDGKEDL